MSQISLGNVGVDYAGVPVIKDVTFSVARGDRWGLVGRNGTGKTTLVNVIAGRLEPTRGSVSRASGLKITLLDQHREEQAQLNVWDAAALPFAQLMALEQSLHAQAHDLAHAAPEALKKYDRDLERFAREGGYEFHARVDAVLQGLGFDPEAARRQPVSQLSGGEAGRVALARQLVAPADVLLLDEPTNHLDIDTTQWLEQYLRDLDATVLVISHDRAFMENVVDHVLHLENGTAYAYRGSYNAFVRQRAEARLSQERQFSKQQAVIAAEEDYIRRNIAGQNSKQAKGRRKRLQRLERLSPPPSEQSVMALRIDNAARGGDQVLVARDVRIRMGERTLIEDFSSRIMRGDVIGLVGANGTGKSTLLRAIVGERSIDEGELRVGESIRVAYYRQDMRQVPLGKTLFSIIHDLRPQWQRGSVQSHLARFGFTGSSVERTADDLSGGERARVALAMLVLAEANFLLFDEPTNHLDVESIEALEDAFDGFDGTILLVSHDRELLRNTATRVWALEQQRITDYNGSFEEWEAVHAEQRAAAEHARQAAKVAQQERERAEARRRQQLTNTDRNTARNRQRAAEAAEAEVHRLEGVIDELKR
ncbi:MAG TPA: ABC-F family ATP-binding cassette domain-containing protein, partial [Longimicrobiales bacterium]